MALSMLRNAREMIQGDGEVVLRRAPSAARSDRPPTAGRTTPRHRRAHAAPPASARTATPTGSRLGRPLLLRPWRPLVLLCRSNSPERGLLSRVGCCWHWCVPFVQRGHRQ